MPFVDEHGRTWLVVPTRKGMRTQEGGQAPKNPHIAYFVFRLADTANINTPVTQEELIEGPDEEKIFTYTNAKEAQRLGYLHMVM